MRAVPGVGSICQASRRLDTYLGGRLRDTGDDAAMVNALLAESAARQS